MVRSLNRLLLLIVFGSLMIFATLPSANAIHAGAAVSGAFLFKLVALSCAALIGTAAFHYTLKRISPFIEENGRAQAQLLDKIDPRYADAAILGAAALSLFLELAVIRWQSTIFEFLAYYKNFSLLACFVGLGLGYALANREHIPLVIVLPTFGWMFAFMIIVRFGPDVPFRANPFREQLAMGIDVVDSTRIISLFALLTIVFLVTAVAFIPIGQMCGRLMEHRTKLRAYGLNLLGSLLGVVVMLLASFLWTPPLAWFMVCFLMILTFQLRKPVTLMVGIASTAVCAVVLIWPVEPLVSRVYSPYQLLEIKANPDTGLTLVRAAGTYFQKVYDFSADKISHRWSRVRDYYDFPYKTSSKLTDVAVVGAGTGNDVAAALRSGAAHVEAIEIDPAIQMIGREDHPERPYENPRVHTVINDARSFFRRTDQSFDLIVYGLLDSHTLLSHGSSVRLDSFVYTVEGLREARNRLKPDGMISLSFSVLSDSMGRKMYLMLQQAFDGRPPMCVATEYDGSVIFLASNNANWSLPPAVIAQSGFTQRTSMYANPSLRADVSTDDWPFLYMPLRIYPVSYLIMVVQIVLLSVLITGNFLSEKPRFSHLSFFFLGVGFMLIETKGITEMGLTFGNTWQVIGFVIAGILIMAFLGNCAVQWLNIRRPLVPYLFLWAALAIGWFVARSGGFPSTPLGRFETAIVLTCPVLFSGIVFSTLLSGKGRVSGMMASNLLGAICGGLLEYNSMYFGFRSLYIAALACYVLAFASELLFAKKQPEREGGAFQSLATARMGSVMEE
jgi:spermidine synthase